MYILTSPFRLMFACAFIYGFSAITLWLYNLYIGFPELNNLSSSLRHGHEMVFGFGSAILAGFLLTATPNWTNTKAVNKRVLLCLGLLWTASRLYIWLSGDIYHAIVAIALQSLFWLALFYFTLRPIIVTRNWKNGFIGVFIITIMGINLCVLALPHFGQANTASHLLQSTILLFCLLIGVIGARVIPFFTYRATGITTSQNKLFNQVLLAVSLLGIGGFISSAFWGGGINPGWFMSIAGILHGIRVANWHRSEIWDIPLLWILYVAYFAMALGLVFFALSQFSLLVSQKDALHFLAITGVTSMMVAIAMRVSLGHTGRPLLATKIMTISFIFIMVSGVVRSFGSLFIGVPNVWLASGIVWLTSFALLTYSFFPIFIRPRADHKSV